MKRKKNNDDKIRLSLAGEFGVASELSKLNLNVNISIGNYKGVDILVFGNNGMYKKIEVKTSKTKRFVTGFFKKYGDITQPHPDFWVIVHIDENNISHYYVMTHEEIGNLQMNRNKMAEWKPVPNGVDNLILSNIEEFENCWDKIIKSIS